LQGKLAEAHSAQAHAEEEKEAAQQAAEHDRATIQSLRQQLEQQHQDHRRDLATLRQEAHDERATLTQHYTDQLATLLATIHQTSDPTHTKSSAVATQKDVDQSTHVTQRKIRSTNTIKDKSTK
jgi:phage host-nuclease inhibitor protein Gam